MKFIKRKKKNRGFTLVEVLVAAAILSLVVTPILSSFVTIARVNAKSRRELSATTIARSVMESVKGFELAEVSKQCNDSSSGFYVIAGTISEASEVGTASYASGKFTPKDSGEYTFRIKGVRMDGTTYDVEFSYKRNDSRTKSTVVAYENKGASLTPIPGLTTANVLGAEGVRVLVYYDVEVKVYRGETNFSASALLTTLTGSKADYTPTE